jgi:hypothetical protein
MPVQVGDLATTFAVSLEMLFDEFSPAAPEDVERARQRGRRGAAVVERCVEAFVWDEIEPKGEPIGRHWTVPMPPIPGLVGVGSSSPPRTVERLAAALIRTLATGYAMALLLETASDSTATPRDERDAALVWRWWVPRIGRFAAEEVIAKEPVMECRQKGRSELRYLLAQIGLKPSLRKRYRFGVTAGMYAEAGMLLRVPQSGMVTDEFFAEDPLAAVADRWPFDDFPGGIEPARDRRS